MRLAWMQRFDGVPADPESLLMAEIGKAVGIVPVGPARAVSGDEHAFGLVETVRRIDDVLIETVGPGEAAIDEIVRLPEAWRFERQLDAAQIRRSGGESRLLRRREVAGNTLQYR